MDFKGTTTITARKAVEAAGADLRPSHSLDVARIIMACASMAVGLGMAALHFASHNETARLPLAETVVILSFFSVGAVALFPKGVMAILQFVPRLLGRKGVE